MDNQGTQISILRIASHLQHHFNEVRSPIKFEISSGKTVDPEGAGLVIFTSGTTGPPKGAVHRREFIIASAEEVALHYQITREDSILHVLPVHHATGVLINFLPFILTGACVEFQSGGFDEQRTWDRWRQGRGTITFFSGVPTIYMRMMRYFEKNISKLETCVRDEYVAGARQLRVLTCGSSAFPAPAEESWARILAGKRILTRYGSTEAGVVFMISPADSESVP
jgi:malonyl-CoA/methylmalonyl-CoA synthetase